MIVVLVLVLVLRGDHKWWSWFCGLFRAVLGLVGFGCQASILSVRWRLCCAIRVASNFSLFTERVLIGFL